MNAPNHSYQEEHEPEYQADYRRAESDSERTGDQRGRKPNYARSGSRPNSFNGIHRRRNKRWNW